MNNLKLDMKQEKELKKIHQYAAPKHISSWYERKAIKHEKYLKNIQHGVRTKNENNIKTFIEDNMSLTKERPNIFQHDDFHAGNIIINNNKELTGIIDFNRYDWGDPYMNL